PSVEVGHPVRNVHVQSVDTGCRNLPDSLHIGLAPVRCIWADPYVFIPWLDPEGCTRMEHRRFARNLPLHPLRMIFHHSVSGLVSIWGNTLRSGHVDESSVACQPCERLRQRHGWTLSSPPDSGNS